MEPRDLEKLKAVNDSVLKDSATSSSNYRVLPPRASVSLDTGLRNLAKRPHPFEREPALNWQSATSKNVRGQFLSTDSNSSESETIGDDRDIFERISWGFYQPVHEATLPVGLLSVSLFRHQKIALAWMLQRENSVACSGGFLADAQGLGKTISIIALIQMHKSSSTFKLKDPCVSEAEVMDLDDNVDEDKQCGESAEQKLVTEVNSPCSTREFRIRKPPAGSLVVCPASVLRQWARELDEKVADEAKLEVLIYHGGNRTKDPAELAKYDVVLTTYSVVAKEVPTKTSGEDDDDDNDKLDGDVHRLSSEFANKKRKNSHVSKEGKKGRKGIHSSAVDYTGTLAKVHWFRVILDEAQTIKNSNTQVAKSCCGLRAKKRWCLSGTPIQNSIDELFSYFKFLKCEPFAKYTYFFNEIKIPISRNTRLGIFPGYNDRLFVALWQIMLHRTKDTLIDGQPIVPPITINFTTLDFSAEERAFYLKLKAESISRFKAYSAAGTVTQNYANILSMLLRLRQACDHPFLVKGFRSNDMQANLLNLLETINICLLCSDRPEDAVITICGHIYCHQCVAEYLKGGVNKCPSPDCKSQIGSDVVFTKDALRSCISDDDHYERSSKNEERSSILQYDYASAKIRATLDIILLHCRTNNSSSAGNGSTSSSSASEAEGPIKTIVFSHWTRMLDLVERSLNQHCIEYRRLDGSMSLVSRDKAVKEFNTDLEVMVMLISLKAGNLDLNMVAASHVILLDPWWNPATEDQAIDLAHRIGQTRPVTVSIITIKDTVENRILELQEEKRAMVASAFGEGQSGSSVTSLTEEDLEYLFMEYLFMGAG